MNTLPSSAARRLAGLFLLIALGGTYAFPAGSATILQVSGPVEVRAPGQSTFQALAAGQEVAAGSTIRTGPGAQVGLSPLAGVVASLGASGELALETLDPSAAKPRAVLALAAGTLVSDIDPARAGTVDYAVRTAKGLAAASGTNYSVSYDTSTGLASVSVFTGGVQMRTTDGTVVRIEAGSICVTPQGASAPVMVASVSELPPEVQQQVTNLVVEAVQVLQVAVEANIGVSPVVLESAIQTMSQAGLQEALSQAGVVSTEEPSQEVAAEEEASEEEAEADAEEDEATTEEEPTEEVAEEGEAPGEEPADEEAGEGEAPDSEEVAQEDTSPEEVAESETPAEDTSTSEDTQPPEVAESTGEGSQPTETAPDAPESPVAEGGELATVEFSEQVQLPPPDIRPPVIQLPDETVIDVSPN